MNYKIKLLALIFIFFSINTFSQKKETKNRFSFNAGYGLAGSFFVRSYEENQIPIETSFFKKNFVGTNLFFEFEVNLKKNYSLGFHYSRQSFSETVIYDNQFGNVVLSIDEKIRHFNNIWGVSLNKYFIMKKNSFSIGLGPYYIIPQQQEISILQLPAGTIIDIEERNQKNSNLNEAGAFVDFSYNYQFQPRVEIGVKSQFYYTISANYAESITLFPYVKIKF